MIVNFPGNFKSGVEKIEEQKELLKGVSTIQVGIEEAASSGNLGRLID